MRNRKAHGGPVDVIHTLIIIGAGVVLLRASMTNTILNTEILFFLGIVIIVLEILGMLM